jgi:hypothetical protein
MKQLTVRSGKGDKDQFTTSWVARAFRVPWTISAFDLHSFLRSPDEASFDSAQDRLRLRSGQACRSTNTTFSAAC